MKLPTDSTKLQGQPGALRPLPWESPRAGLMLVLLGLLIYLPFLGGRGLWFPDEPDLGEAIREMMSRADWIVPTLGGEAWPDYPPMIYWLGRITSELLGGLSEFAIRLPSALCAIALVWATWRFALPRIGACSAFLSAVILLTAPHFAYQATNVHPDMCFSFFVGAGLFVYVQGLDREKASTRVLSALLAFVLFGLAFLSKHALGLLLPGMVLVLWHASERNWKQLMLLAPLALVSLAVAFPWYAAYASQVGAESAWHEFQAQNFARFFSSVDRGHGGPWFYYLTRIWGDLAPWSLLIPLALAQDFRRRVWEDRWMRLCFLWFVSFFVFFSLAQTKREVYLLACYPALAILIASWISSRLRAWRFADEVPVARPHWLRLYLLLSGWLFWCLGIALLLLAIYPNPLVEGLKIQDRDHRSVIEGLRIPAAMLAVLLLAGGHFSLRCRRGLRLGWSLVGQAATLGCIWFLLSALFFPAIDRVKSYRYPSEWIAERTPLESPIGLFYPGRARLKWTGFLYYSGRNVEILQSWEEARAFSDRNRASVLVVSEEAFERLARQRDGRVWRKRQLRTWQVGSTNYHMLRSR